MEPSIETITGLTLALQPCLGHVRPIALGVQTSIVLVSDQVERQ